MSVKENLETARTAMMRRSGPSSALKLSALRMVLTDITRAEVATKPRRELSDAETEEVIRTAVKQRRKASDEYAERGVMDRAQIERAEAEYLETFTTPLMSETDIRATVRAVIAKNDYAGMAHMGAVMSTLKKQPTPFDGTLAAKIVREELTNGVA